MEHGATVYLACRRKGAAEKTIQEPKEATGKEGRFLSLDLADLASVKLAAETFISYGALLFICSTSNPLISTAPKKSCIYSSTTRSLVLLERAEYFLTSLLRGLSVPPKNLVTVQGYDLQFGTNTLGKNPLKGFNPVFKPTHRTFLLYPTAASHDAVDGEPIWCL